MLAKFKSQPGDSNVRIVLDTLDIYLLCNRGEEETFFLKIISMLGIKLTFDVCS
jgi:hypothetical protein